MPKIIIIIRHGDYCAGIGGGTLSSTGAESITGLAKKLRDQFGNKRIKLFSSTAGRAVGSAEIISRELNIPYEATDLLWTGPDGKNQHSRCGAVCSLMDLDAETEHEVTGLITHHEYGKDLPNFIGKQYLDGKRFEHGELSKGRAFVIDLETKELVLI